MKAKAKEHIWEEWKDMPEFVQEDQESKFSVVVHFENENDLNLFCWAVGRKVTTKTKGIFYPAKPKSPKLVYREDAGMVPKYPVYIVSKGRADRQLTSKALDAMGVPHRIVIEPPDYDAYAAAVGKEKLLVVPFNDLGQGSIPARNWIWDHAVKSGAERHWVLDDNINGFERLNRNQRGIATGGTIFRCSEIFVDRYENVAFAGFEYRQFAGGARRPKPPFRLNTRIYSCILVKNDLPYRWRGRYNEDTDICLRALKDGWCTVLFQCFLQNKVKTMAMKGGNTDTVYADDKTRKEFAQSLQEQHPDVVEVVWRYNRWHHKVNYKPFEKNGLKKVAELAVSDGVNNFGMELASEDS